VVVVLTQTELAQLLELTVVLVAVPPPSVILQVEAVELLLSPHLNGVVLVTSVVTLLVVL
jgi:hypothetical protein